MVVDLCILYLYINLLYLDETQSYNIAAFNREFTLNIGPEEPSPSRLPISHALINYFQVKKAR